VKRLAGPAVFVIALLLRLAYVAEHDDVLGLDYSKLSQTDNHVFAIWAEVIADGDWLCREQPHAYHLWTRDVAPESRWLEWYGGEQTFHQAPLYPYMVAAVYATLGRAHLMVGIMQAVLGALTCWLTYLIGRRACGLRTGVIAGLLLAFLGSYYFYDAFILRDGPMAFFVALSTFALQRAADRGKALDWFAAGASLGLFTLAKETGPALLALTVIGLAWLHWKAPRKIALTAGAAVVGWLLITSPAYLRNHEVGAPLFKLSTRGPEVFVTGNARGQDGVGWDPPADLMREILMDSNFRLSKAMVLTVATHRADPWGYVELLGHKTKAFLNGYEVPNNTNFYLSRAHLTTLNLGFVSMTFLSPAALLGLLLGLRYRRKLAVPYLMFGAIAGSVILLYILSRFRVQALPLFAVFGAVFVDWVLRAIAARRVIAMTCVAVPFVALVAWCWPERDPYDETNRNASVMLSHIKAGDFDQARHFRDRMVDVIARSDPSRFDASLTWKLAALDDAFDAVEAALAHPDTTADRWLGLGHGYASLLPITKRGERVEFTELALAAFAKAREVDPETVGTYHGAGTVHGTLEDLPTALHLFRKELEHHPDHPESHRDAGLIFFAWGQYPTALAHFRESLALGLEDSRSLACAGFVHINTSLMDTAPVRVQGQAVDVYDPDRGLRFALQALELDPDGDLVREQCATVLYTHDRMDEAEALLMALAEDLPHRAAEFRDRARLYRSAYDLRMPSDSGDDDSGSDAASDAGSDP